MSDEAPFKCTTLCCCKLVCKKHVYVLHASIQYTSHVKTLEGKKNCSVSWQNGSARLEKVAFSSQFNKVIELFCFKWINNNPGYQSQRLYCYQVVWFLSCRGRKKHLLKITHKAKHLPKKRKCVSMKVNFNVSIFLALCVHKMAGLEMSISSLKHLRKKASNKWASW